MESIDARLLPCPSGSMLAALAGCIALAAPASAQGWRVKLALDAPAHQLSLDPFVGINDRGVVGFAAVGPQGSAGYVLQGHQVSMAAIPIPGRQYLGGAVDEGLIPGLVTREREPGSPALFRVRRWLADQSTNVLIGNSQADFNSASAWVDVNSSNVVAFTALINGSTQTALMAGTQKPPTTLAQYSGNQPLRPQISDDNWVVIKDNLGVILWPYPSGAPAFIAGFGDGFLGLGNFPGISANGNAVAFAGDRGLGEGVFASVRTPTGRHLVALAGDGSADGFTDFDETQRIGVASFGASSFQTVLALFVGTRNGVVGVYSSSALVSDTSSGFSVTPQGIQRVVAVGDVLGGKQLASFLLYHPLNARGEAAFAVAFSDGTQGIARAAGDVDGDGLLDRWETHGVDLEEDGVVELDLPALGADPMHKDVFVEIDAMVGFAPIVNGLDRVTTAFAVAPVANPDGQNGVRLHAILDEIDLAATTWPALDATGWPIDFDAAKGARFGTPSERAAGADVLEAKRMAFRYCVFADRFGAKGNGGLAELGGNDFMVTLGAYNTPGGTEDEQASTFMHELGHALGLRHGGGDHLNYKPNYFSVMNYAWSVPGPLNLLDWDLRFSDHVAPSLDESALDEGAGLGLPPFTMLAIGPPPIAFAIGSGPIDLDHDTFTTSTGVMRDLNWLDAAEPATPGEVFHGHDDWSNLVYDFRSSTDYADGLHPSNTSLDEISDAIVDMLASLRPLPGVYCVAKVDSVGCTPRIGFDGMPSLTGPDDFFLNASDVRNGKNGMLVWSRSPAATPFFGGTLCVEAPMLRIPVLTSGGSATGNDCTGSFSTHFDQAYMAQQGLTAGDAAFAQFWSRDASTADPIGVSLTAGVAFVLAP